MTIRASWLLVLYACSSSSRDAPVIGSGSGSAHGSGQAAPLPRQSPCPISSLVDDRGLWLATRAGICYAPRRDGELDHDWAQQQLARLREAYGGECSPDVELAVDGGTYDDVVQFIDDAIAARVDAGLADRGNLAIQLPGAISTAAAECAAPAAVAAALRLPRLPAKPVRVITKPSGEIAGIRITPEDLDLPKPEYMPLQVAPAIVVTTTDVLLEGKVIARVAEIPRDGSSLLAPLEADLRIVGTNARRKLSLGYRPDQLAACDEIARGVRARTTEMCPTPLAILQADRSVDARAISTIVRTAKAAGFDNVMFALKQQ